MDRLSGLPLVGPQRSGDPIFRGEVYALYVLAEYQNRGVGRGLVRAVADRLAHDGTTSILIWVLANNPARGFYAHLGGVEIRHQPIPLGTVTVEEVAYGWKNTRALINSRR